MPKESTTALKKRTLSLIKILNKEFPNAHCALDHEGPYQLLVATMLSAQCTDARVNKVTPNLFSKAPDPESMIKLSQEDLESLIMSTGFFRNKAKNILNCSKIILEKHQGKVPDNLESLSALPGVGRKTANVVLGNHFGIPAMVVDTHVTRISNRLGLTKNKNAVKIEFDLMKIIPEVHWTNFSHWLILHGRKTCTARLPKCNACPLKKACPSKGHASDAWK